jgi:hypothetical protein
MKQFLAVAALFVSISASAEISQEMHMPMDPDGYLTITVESCLDTSINKEYTYRAYAETDGNHFEGCWYSPEVNADSPKGFEPLVIIYFDKYNTNSYFKSYFSHKKERWTDTDNPFTR